MAKTGTWNNTLIQLLGKANPLDRLGLITLLSSLYFFQIWGLTFAGSSFPPALHAALMVWSVAGFLVPRLTVVLLVNSIAFCGYFLLQSPVISNNLTTAFAFALIVVLANYTQRTNGPETPESRDTLFCRIAGPGRWILAGMYFYGIYHKINTDFLDPAVSCAVELYRPLAEVVWLEDWWLGHYGAIYATFVIEAIAMVALFIPRLKYVGFSLGLPFHIIIGFTGYAFYKDFSTIVLVLYVLFLPAGALPRAFELAQRVFGANTLAYGRLGLICFALLYALTSGALFHPASAMVTHENFVWYFAVYALGFYAFTLLCVPRVNDTDNGDGLRAGWLIIVPLLYFLNGTGPYTGLRTEGTIAMFSNLHTEGGQTNHLLGRIAPQPFGYQEDVVVPVGSNNPTFNHWIVETDTAMVRYSFDRLLANTPDLVVDVQTHSGVVSTADGWDNTYLNASWLARKYLIFKPVDFARPKVCTH